MSKTSKTRKHHNWNVAIDGALQSLNTRLGLIRTKMRRLIRIQNLDISIEILNEIEEYHKRNIDKIQELKELLEDPRRTLVESENQ